MAKKTTKYQWTSTEQDTEDDWVSRSQRKRESTALQEMGEELCALGDGALKSIDLPEVLVEAVLEWKRIPSREGKRRQLQYVGRLMREEVEPGQVRMALDAIAEGHAVETQRLKILERLRDQLLAAETAELDALCAPYGDSAARVRELVQQARTEKAAARPPHAFRALFRLLNDVLK